MDQIIILWYWHQDIFSNISNLTEAYIRYNYTVTEYDTLYNTYIGEEINNPTSLYTNREFLPYKEDITVKVLSKDSSMNTWKTADWTK